MSGVRSKHMYIDWSFSDSEGSRRRAAPGECEALAGERLAASPMTSMASEGAIPEAPPNAAKIGALVSFLCNSTYCSVDGL